VAAILIIGGLLSGVISLTAPTASAQTKPSISPVELDIPAIGESIPLINVGLTSGGNMDVPKNFKQAGWYQYGPVPGQEGSAVIAAHVDNGGYKPTTAGVFKHLDQVKPGDIIQARLSDGSLAIFQAVSADVYRTSAFPSQQVFQQGGDSYLKIITCHGAWIPQTHTYDQRLVVTARLVMMAKPS